MISGHKMIILTAPSGAGKTTIARALMQQLPFLEFSISATTRPVRDYETHGVHYYFYSPEEFRSLVKEEALAEYEEVYQDQFYGTLKSEIERIWERGLMVLFDVDVKGALNLKKIYGASCLALFVQPPSFEILRNRLIDRNTEDAVSLQKRLDRAEFELSLADQFDTIIVNDQLEEAIRDAKRKILTFAGIDENNE